MNVKAVNQPKNRAAIGMGLLVLLGAITAFDSLGIDMYTPAFTAMETSLSLSTGSMSLTLSVFLLGLAIGQGIYGPLSDGIGRRKPLLVGILIFGVASVIVAASINMSMLLLGRFLQGIGGAAGLAIPRAIVSDLCEEKDAARLFTILMQVQSVTPIIAPLMGSFVLAFCGWKGIFIFLAGISLLLFGLAVFRIPETLHSSMQSGFSLFSVMRTFARLVKNRRYFLMTLANWAIMGTLLSYISISPFIFVTYFHFSPTTYSFIFSSFAIGMILVGQINVWLCTRLDVKRNLILGFSLHLLFMGVLLCVELCGINNLWIFGILLFFGISCLGFLFGGLAVEAIYSVKHNDAGTASALLGVVQYAGGGVAGMVFSFIHDETLLAPAGLLFFCSVLAFLCWLAGSRAKRTECR